MEKVSSEINRISSEIRILLPFSLLTYRAVYEGFYGTTTLSYQNFK